MDMEILDLKYEVADRSLPNGLCEGDTIRVKEGSITLILQLLSSGKYDPFMRRYMFTARELGGLEHQVVLRATSMVDLLRVSPVMSSKADHECIAVNVGFYSSKMVCKVCDKDM